MIDSISQVSMDIRTSATDGTPTYSFALVFLPTNATFSAQSLPEYAGDVTDRRLPGVSHLCLYRAVHYEWAWRSAYYHMAGRHPRWQHSQQYREWICRGIWLVGLRRQCGRRSTMYGIGIHRILRRGGTSNVKCDRGSKFPSETCKLRRVSRRIRQSYLLV